MAPATTDSRKVRDRNPSRQHAGVYEPGVVGRKTGITLPDRGIRDEYGMEPLEGLFSSPEKSPPKRSTGRKSGGTITTSEAMEGTDSSIPEPTQTIKSQNLMRQSKTIFPPPLGRSPKKTNLGSSPRRQSSMGPRSVVRRSMDSPDRPLPRNTARRLDFSAMEEGPTNSTIAQTTPVVRNGTGGRGPVRPDIYDLQESPVRGQKRTYEETVVEEETYTNRESELHFNRLQEDSLLPPVEDESLQFVQGADDESIEANMEDSLPVQETTPPPAKKTRRGKVGRNSTDQASAKVSAPKADRRGGVRPGSGRKPKPVLPNKRAARLSIAEETSPEPQPKNHAPVQHVTKTKRKVLEPEPEEVELDSSDEVELPVEESVVEPEPEPMPPPRKPGRPKAVNVHRDPASAAKDEPAFKVPALPQKRGPKPKATPSERDPNVTAGSVAAFRQERSASKAASEAPTNASTMSRRPPIARGLQYLRQGTPMEDAGMRTTRSGRSSIKPVEWWKGEGVKYDYTGGNVEVVRAEEREVAKPKRGRQKQKRKVKAEESDDDEELADWEADPGILQGSVYIWDPELGIATNEVEDQDIAMTRTAYPTKEVAGGNFQFTKLLTIKDFFGAGVIDLPPGGFKRPRNSRQMQLVFYVLEGMAEVTVADEKFDIHKGGFWQVPRGNSYSIENTSQRHTRLFFSQANEKPTPAEP